MRPTRLTRLLRGSIAAGFATFVALFSHVAAGGAMPGPLGILAPLILSVMVSVLVAGRRHSLARLAISVIVSQLLFHTLFVLGTPRAPGATGGHHSPLIIPTSVGVDLPQNDAAMWFGHALAAAVTIAALASAERVVLALGTLVARFRRWWTGVHQPVLVVLGRPSRLVGTTLPVALLRLDLDLASRRGPPALLA